MNAVRAHRLELGLFALVLVTCAYFVQGAGANQNSRYALVRSLVEEHSFEISRFSETTFDRATVGLASFSDKATGLSLVAAIPYAAGARLAQPRGQTEPDPLALHLVTVATIGLATALAAIALRRMLIAAQVSRRTALVAVVAWVFGTNAFGYATLFYGHQLVASLLVIALAGIRSLQERERVRAFGFGIGVALGLAAISEFPAATLAGGLGIYALATIGLRRTMPIMLGVLVPALVLAAYNTSCFGSPVHLGYASLANPHFRSVMGHGVAGIGAPSAHVLAELLLFEYRGLLPLSPFLILAAPGVVWMARDRRHRALAALCAIAFAGFAILMSGYLVWDGGAAMGARHLVPALPFAIIPVAFALDRLRAWRWAHVLALGTVAAAIAICTMCVAVGPEFSDGAFDRRPAPDVAMPDWQRPLTTLVVPMFVRGELGTKASRAGWIDYAYIQGPGHEDDAYNLGEVVGLRGLASVLPLVLLWIGGALFLRRDK